MDTRQNRTKYRKGSAFRLLRSCYQSFLLHFLLGLSVSSLLLLSAVRIHDFLPTVPVRLAGTVFPVSGIRQTVGASRTTLSRTALSFAVYAPDGLMNLGSDAAESGIHTARTPHIPYRDSIVQRTKDDTEANLLSPPELNTEGTLYNPEERSSSIPSSHIGIRSIDLSAPSRRSETAHGILFSNQTAFTPDAAAYLNAPYPIPAADLPAMRTQDPTDTAAPLVLILHTHGTEAYAPDHAASVPTDYAYRSEDITENVVSVGSVLASTLTDAGIPTLHCQTMFDAESYTESYRYSADYIQKTLSEYPSIRYVFDVHRDALQDADGTVLRPVTLLGGEVCAQIMSVVGTDGAGGNHPDWQDNLTVAVHLQKRLNDTCPALARPINLRTATFNAQYATGSLLLEIGAAGNSVTEARSAAYHLGRVLADMILQGQ